MKYIKHLQANKLTSITYSKQRRQALKDLKNLSIVGVGSLIGFKALQDSKTSFESIESNDSIESYSIQDKSSYTQDLSKTHQSLFSSNIPSYFLSLPLTYFNVPQDYSIILESNLTRNQRENITYIVPLLTSKDFNHAMPSLYHSYNVENIATKKIFNQTSKFLQYHYDTLGSLLKDLESRGFVIRDYRALSQDSKEPTQNLMQETMQNIIIDNTTSHISIDNIRKYQVQKGSDLYNEFKSLEENNKKLAIDAYNEALEILNDYKDYFFTNTTKRNAQGEILSYKEDKDKARKLMQCLDTIGRNNIRALYVGVNKERKSGKSPTSIGTTNNDKEKSQENIKRPKLIGRLATTIIIEDGLWLG